MYRKEMGDVLSIKALSDVVTMPIPWRVAGICSVRLETSYNKSEGSRVRVKEKGPAFECRPLCAVSNLTARSREPLHSSRNSNRSYGRNC